jgi:hypothetical protein
MQDTDAKLITLPAKLQNMKNRQTGVWTEPDLDSQILMTHSKDTDVV